MKPAPGRSPDYRLKKAHRELPQGAFIKPVRFEYLSPELKKEFQYYNPNTEAICYTPLGYMTVPLVDIQEA